MTNEPDMTTPVTRRELNDALDLWAGAIKAELTVQMAQQRAQLTAQMAELSVQLTSQLGKMMNELLTVTEDRSHDRGACLGERHRTSDRRSD